MFTCLWLMLVGGLPVLKIALGNAFGFQKRVVQRALDNGAIEYHVIVAKKPLTLDVRVNVP